MRPFRLLSSLKEREKKERETERPERETETRKRDTHRDSETESTLIFLDKVSPSEVHHIGWPRRQLASGILVSASPVLGS